MKKNIWLRLIKYFDEYKFLFIFSLMLALLIIAADLINPYITKIIMDDYVTGRDPNLNIYLLGGLLIGSVVIEAVTQYSQTNLLNYMGQKIINKIRREVFVKVQHFRLSFFDHNSSGSILTRGTSDIEALSELYSGVAVTLFKDIFMIIGIIVMMISLSPSITGVSLIVIPIIVAITIPYNKLSKMNFRRVRQFTGQINAFFAENISGMRIVQIFNREKEKFKEFEKLNDGYNEVSIYGVKLNALFRPASEFINSFSVALLVWFCTTRIFNGSVEIGVLYAFISYGKKFFQPIAELADKYTTIQSGVVSAERIFELLDIDDAVEDLDDGMRLEKIVGKIEFKDVWFAYNEDDWVLKGVSFTVDPGHTAAFVGETGSGKTTIISLLARFYEIQKGEILLDGVNISKYRLSDLRKAISVVMQDVFLFSGDIESNIRLFNNEISDEVVVAAAEYVNASAFIEKLPGKYKEEVKERGATLSSGEKQLISFARAVAFNPSILVLDEATANIDTETEQIIQESLKKISKDRTTLIIAHRLSTIRSADIIIVINKGEILEMGNHDELMERGGFYKTLYDTQLTVLDRKI